MFIIIRKMWNVNVKVTLNLICRQKGDDETKLHPYTTSALDGVNGQHQSPAALPPVEGDDVTAHFIGTCAYM
jgi:hypothetical protein